MLLCTDCVCQICHSLITQHPWVVVGTPKPLIRYDYTCGVWENELKPVVYQISFDILLCYAIICLLGRFELEQIIESVFRLLSTDREKNESGWMFNIKMPVLLHVGYCFILMTITINYILRLLITFML